MFSGLPQSSLLGPLLFLIHSADLKNDISSPISFYVDYIKIYNNNQGVLSSYIKKVILWSNKCLMVNCVVLHIGWMLDF